MTRVLCLVLLLSAFVVWSVSETCAQTTEFTFQGSLKDGSNPANGNYDFEFLLFDSLAGPTQLGATLQRSGVGVSNGTFAVKLDFGGQFPGANRFLEIRVRVTGGGAFTPLSPRQQVNSTPYSVQSLTAATAANATTATTATNALQLGGVAAGQYVLTTDPRMSDPRAPTAGSGNYIQNTTSPQALSNFNISDTGTAKIFNATTQFSIGGNQVLSVAGMGNIFAGVGAGASNTSLGNSFVGAGAGGANTGGDSNSFFGFLAGNSNTTGFGNSFFGRSAGTANTTAFGNSFFGRNAGAANVTGDSNSFFGFNTGDSNTTGIRNSFFGIQAGQANTIGDVNSFFGASAGFNNITGTSNSFFGASAGQTNTDGSLNSFVGVLAGFLNTTGAANTFVGAGAGDSNTTGGNNTIVGNSADVGSGALNFATALGAGVIVGTSNTVVLGRAADTVQVPGALSVTGVSTFAGQVGANILNAATQFNLGGNRVLSVAGTDNIFGGVGAGIANTGFSNSFFGASAGEANTSGSGNSFVGRNAGRDNTTGFNDTFVGLNAGRENTAGRANAFFGTNAGFSNLDGDANSFFGAGSGTLNTSGTGNSFFGEDAGTNNTIGARNSFLGHFAGLTQTTGNNNTILGSFADVGSGTLTFATALGAAAVVSTSNTVVLGRTLDNVRVPGTLTVSGAGASASIHVSTNSGNVLIGNMGCSAPSNGISFSTTLNCNNYSVLGDGIGTSINRPLGGNLDFRENSSVQMSIAAGGIVRIVNLAGATATTLCRTASNEIAACTSASRYKEKINSFNPGLDLIKRLRPVTFNWIGGGDLDLGLVAEDVAAVEPLLTTTNAKGEIEGVKYDRVGVVLVNAVKEQQAQIEAQAELIKRQQQQIDSLTKLLCATNRSAEICKE